MTLRAKVPAKAGEFYNTIVGVRKTAFFRPTIVEEMNDGRILLCRRELLG